MILTLDFYKRFTLLYVKVKDKDINTGVLLPNYMRDTTLLSSDIICVTK